MATKKSKVTPNQAPGYYDFVDNRPSFLPYTAEEYMNGNLELPKYYQAPKVFSLNPKYQEEYTVPRLRKLWMMDSPVLIFGEPFSGKTSFMRYLACESSAEFGPKHWTKFIDLRDWIELLRSPGAIKYKPPKTFVELLSKQMKVPEKQLRDLFRPLPNAKDHVQKKKFEKLIRADIFLDGFDELPPLARDYILKMLATVKHRRVECPVRIWLSCRNYLKSKLLHAFGINSAFEIAKLERMKQMEFLYFAWRKSIPKPTKESDTKLWRYTQRVYHEIELETRDLEHTIGAIPLYLQIIMRMLLEHMEIFVTQDRLISPCIVTADFFDVITYSLIQYYCHKMKHVRFEQSMVEPEFHHFEQLCAKYAMQTFPTFALDPKTGFIQISDLDGKLQWTKSKQLVRVDEELFRAGFLVDDDEGIIRFANKIFGNFFIGKFFSRQHSLETGDAMCKEFFLRVLLVDTDAKPARSFFDAFVQFSPSYRPKILSDFLVSHYKLAKADEDEWSTRKDDGNIWHLAVAEGLLAVARVISDALVGPRATEYRRAFFRMRVPMQFFEESRNVLESAEDFDLRIMEGEKHLITCTDLLALFGHHSFIAEFLTLFIKIYGPREIRNEFHQQGFSTPLHYAAMHSNLWFLREIFSNKVFYEAIQPSPGMRNKDGQLPLHMIVKRTWSHYLYIKDHCIPECHDFCLVAADMANNQPVQKTSTKKTKIKNGKSRKSQNDSSQVKPVYPRHSRDFVFAGEIMKSFNIPLMLDAHLGCIEMFAVNVRQDLNAGVEGNGMTILHLAIVENQLETVCHLIRLGADLNVRNNSKMKPMHTAGLQGRRRIFICLAKHGGNPLERSLEIESPFQMWCSSGRKIDKADGEMSESEAIFFRICSDLSQALDDRANASSEDIDDSDEEYPNDVEQEIGEIVGEVEVEETEERVTSTSPTRKSRNQERLERWKMIAERNKNVVVEELGNGFRLNIKKVGSKLGWISKCTAAFRKLALTSNSNNETGPKKSPLVRVEDEVDSENEAYEIADCDEEELSGNREYQDMTIVSSSLTFEDIENNSTGDEKVAPVLAAKNGSV